MLHDPDQLPQERETLFDILDTFGFLLSYYSEGLCALLVGFCIDMALLVTALCTHLAEHLFDAIVDCLPGPVPCELGDVEEAGSETLRLFSAIQRACGYLCFSGSMAFMVWSDLSFLSLQKALVAAVLTIVLLLVQFLLTEEMLRFWQSSYELHRRNTEVARCAAESSD